MSEIRIQKIDGQEFVPYKDYQKLKSDYDRLDKVASENVRTLDELNAEIIDLEEENKKLKEKIEQIKEAYIRFEDSWGEYNKGLGELDQLIMNR